MNLVFRRSFLYTQLFPFLVAAFISKTHIGWLGNVRCSHHYCTNLDIAVDTNPSFKSQPSSFVVIEDRVISAMLRPQIHAAADGAEAPKSLSKEEAVDYLKRILSSEQWNSLISLRDEACDSPKSKAILRSSYVVEINEVMTKDERTTFHKSIKAAFDNELVSETGGMGGSPGHIKSTCTSFLVYFKGSKSPELGKSATKRWEGSYDYSHFTAIKSLLTTAEVIDILCKKTGHLSNRFEFCGRKDKKGITLQRFSAWRVDQSKLKSITKSDSLILRDFENSSVPLKLGNLAGNMFFVKFSGQEVTGGLSRLENIIINHGKNSFVNIFGTQRFGFPLPINPGAPFPNP